MKKKRLQIGLICCLIASIATGCGKEKNDTSQNQMQETVQESTQTDEEIMGTGIDDFNNLMTRTNDPEDLYQFMDQNIGNYEHQDSNSLVTGIIGFHDDISQVDFERIARHTDVMSDEMKDFVELMVMEQQTPAVSDSEIKITLTDLLNRCKTFEDHITKYSDGVTYRYAYERYCKLLTSAITGGYNGEDISTHFYADEENSQTIDNLAIDAYQSFIDDNPNTMTAQILEEYIDTLANNDNNINNNVNEYYQSLTENIQTRFNS